MIRILDNLFFLAKLGFLFSVGKLIALRLDGHICFCRGSYLGISTLVVWASPYILIFLAVDYLLCRGVAYMITTDLLLGSVPARNPLRNIDSAQK